MCRRIITHHMHHDVRQPMVIEGNLSDEPTVYANPLRTSFHRCEVSRPCERGWLLNTPLSCTYHTCCTPREEILYCQEMKLSFLDAQGCYTINDLDERLAWEHEPEECEVFSLVHRHEQLSYFGIPGAYPSSHDPYEYPYYPSGAFGALATWREDIKEFDYCSKDWFIGFAHDIDHREKWDMLMFQEFGKLYEAECDVRVQKAVAADLISANCPDDRWKLPLPSLQSIMVAWNNVTRAEESLSQQRQFVEELMLWAREPCDSCVGF